MAYGYEPPPTDPCGVPECPSWTRWAEWYNHRCTEHAHVPPVMRWRHNSQGRWLVL